MLTLCFVVLSSFMMAFPADVFKKPNKLAKRTQHTDQKQYKYCNVNFLMMRIPQLNEFGNGIMT